MKTSKKLLARNYEVLIMNCIYKINKYKLSLLVIVGHICIGITFYADFCFLFDEIQKDYAWAFSQMHQLYEQLRFSKFNVYVIDCEKTLLNALAAHNPRAGVLLCLWHIEQNIDKNCKKYFDNEEV